MPFTLHPHSDGDRDTILGALARFRVSREANPHLLMFDQNTLSPLCAAYSAACEAHIVCSCAAWRARHVAKQAGLDLDRDLRRFASEIRDSKGRAQPRLIAELLGGKLPSALLRCPLKERAMLARGLCIQAPIRVDMHPNPALIAALRTSSEALTTATDQDERAVKALKEAGTALTRATRELDRGYSRFVNLARALLSPIAFQMVIPRFLVRKSVKRRNADRAAASTGSPGPGPQPPRAPSR